MPLLSLPEEVLLLILSSLGAPDILAFALVNKNTSKFYSSSSRLQYIAELDAAGCLDPSLEAPYTCQNSSGSKGDGSLKNSGPSTSVSISEKLAYLRTRESRWRELDLRRNAKNLPLDREVEVSVYDLSAGVFVFAENERENILSFIDLKDVSMGQSIRSENTRKDLDDESVDEEAAFPRTENGRTILPRTDVPWQKFSFPAPVADFAHSLKEYDLIVFISHEPKKHDNSVLNVPGLLEIKLHLLNFSSRTPHTLAKEPIIKLTEKPATYRRPSPAIEVSGKYIAIVLNFPRSIVQTVVEVLFVINWHTGRIIHHQSYINSMYHTLAFVTPSLFVLPNLAHNSLDLLHIFTDPDDTNAIEHVVYLRKLCLPELAPQFKLRSAICRGDPNPCSSTPDILNPNRDISTIAHDTQRRKDWGAARHGITVDPLRAIVSFKLIIAHESAEIPFGPAVNLVVHRSSLALLALDGLEQRKISFLSSSSSSRANIGSTYTGISLPEMTGTIPKSEWAAWGPEVTRWKLEENFVDWITTTAGQRQVLTSLSRGWQPAILVRDYNPYEVRRMRARALASRSEDTKKGENGQEQQSKGKGKAKEETGENNSGTSHGKDADAREIHIHIDSIDGESASDSEDEDEFGLGGRGVTFIPGLHGNQVEAVEQGILDINIPAIPAISYQMVSVAEYMAATTATAAPASAAAATATSESSIPFPPSSASSNPSGPNPSSSSTGASQTSNQTRTPGSEPPRTPSLLEQLWVEERDGDGEGADVTSSNSGVHKGNDGADALEDHNSDYFHDFDPDEGVDQSHASQSLPPRPQLLRLTSIRVRDTTPSLKVRYYSTGQVQGGLPCVEYTIAGDESLYSGLLMDEERIIGYLDSTNNQEHVSRMTQMCVFSMYP